jgi:putative ABC transport system permease protein
MSNRTLLRKMVRDLRAALGQTIALATIVALAVASLIAMAGAYRDLGQSYRRTYDQLRLADAEFALGDVPDSALQSVAATPGVAALTGRLVVDGGLDLSGRAGAEDEVIRSRLIGLPQGRHPDVNDVLVLSGRYFEPGDSAAVLLESHFARAWHLGPGDSVTPVLNGRRVTLKVVGVVASPEYLIVSPSRQEIVPSARTFAVLFVAGDELGRVAGRSGSVNDVSVIFAPGANRDSTVRALQEHLSRWSIITTTLQADMPSVAGLRLDLEGYKELADLMPGLILLVAAFALYVMLGRLVRGQRPQIGLMKALGYGNRTIVTHYLLMALAIAVLGSIVGVAGGIPLNRAITTAYAGELGIPLVATHVYPDLIAVGVVASLLAAVLAGVGPARASARLDPARAMQLNPSESLVRGRRSALERLLRPPLYLRLPLRSVFRVRWRSLSTGMGIVFAYVLVLVGLGMISAMQRMMARNFHKVERWDVSAMFSTPLPQTVLDSVSSWPGVFAVTPFVQLPAQVERDGRTRDILLSALEPGQKLHVLTTSSGRPVELTRGHIVLTPAIAGKLGLRVGDSLDLRTSFGSRRLAVGGLVDELMASVGYVPLDDLRSWLEGPGPVFNGLYLTADSARARDIKRRLYSIPGAIAVQLKTRVEQDWASLMGLLNAFMGVVLVFALAMAFALLYNAMTINVLERGREFATMRSIGANHGRIALLVTTENIVLWLLTLVPGLALGWWVAGRMGDAFQSDLFTFTVSVGPGDMAVAALGILMTMLLAALPAIRRVNRINLADAVKILT